MGRGLPFFSRCNLSRVRVSHWGGRRERAGRDPAEEGRQGRADLVGVHLARNAKQVRDVLRASARGARRGEGRVVQTSEGPIRPRGSWGRLQQRIAVGLRALGGEVGRSSLAHDRS